MLYPMTTRTKPQTFRCEVLVKGKWLIASRGWSAVERDATQGKLTPGVRFVAE